MPGNVVTYHDRTTTLSRARQDVGHSPYAQPSVETNGNDHRPDPFFRVSAAVASGDAYLSAVAGEMKLEDGR